MRLPLFLLSLLSTASTLALPPTDLIPAPKLTNISYWGSACPENGLTYTLSAPTNTTLLSHSSSNSTTFPLSFTLSNFHPNFGSFGATLRMCNVVTLLTVEKGWRAVVNGGGTRAVGDAQMPRGATLYLRGSWAFARPPFDQSIGMLDVPGPLAGPFSRLLAPVEGNEKGVVIGCEDAETELDIEFQARAVNDTYGEAGGLKERAADASWTLTTDVDVVRC